MGVRVPVNDKIVATAQELLQKPVNPGWQDRAKLRQIINGKIKSVDVEWWRKENGVALQQQTVKQDKEYKKKLDALKAMADPARNDNEHQRREAEKALAKVEAKGPPKVRIRSAPGLEEFDREQAQRLEEANRRSAKMWEAVMAERARRDAMRNAASAPRAASVNTTKPQPKSEPPPVNTTKIRQATKPVNTTSTKSKPEAVNTTTPRKPRTADRHREPNRDRHSPGYMRDYMRRRRANQRAD